MKRLQLRYKILTTSLALLEEPTVQLAKANDRLMYIILRDSQIHRFKHCYQAWWQFLKNFLEYTHGIETLEFDQALKESYRLGLVTEEENHDLLNMIHDRGQTSDTYHEPGADHLSVKITKYCILMRILANRFERPITQLSLQISLQSNPYG